MGVNCCLWFLFSNDSNNLTGDKRDTSSKWNLSQQVKMDKIIVVTAKLRGTEKEVERMEARFIELSRYEEVISLYVKDL